MNANELRLVDSHAHLEQVEGVEAALRRARDSGVVGIVAVGMNLASNQAILELALENPGFVYPAIGIHPWTIEESELDETIEFIRSNIARCVAVGEIGLDYWIKKEKELQREVFRAMLEIATEHKKPVLTHSRGSYEAVLEMVCESGAAGAVFHWYSGPVEMAKKIIEQGHFISATPAVEYSEKHRAVIDVVPLDNLLLETDCPVEYHGIASEPASIVSTLEHVCKLKRLEPSVVAAATTQNCSRLFGLEKAK